jgi:hypothetical protein
MNYKKQKYHNMKRNLIKEQSTAPEVVNTTTSKHNNILVLAKQYCNLDVNGRYDWATNVGGEEVLRRKRPDGGWNHIMVRNNQVWVQQFTSDEKTPFDAKTPNGRVYRECNEKLGPYMPKPLTQIQNEIIQHYVEQNKQFQKERPTQGEINDKKFEVIDMSTIDPTNFPQKDVAFVYKRANIENILINQYPEVEKALKAAGYTFTSPVITSADFGKKKPILQVLPGDKYQSMFKDKQPNVWPTGQKTVDVTKSSAKELLNTWKNKEIKRSDCRSAIKTLYHDFMNPGDTILTDDSQVIAFKDTVYLCKTRKDFAGGIIGVGDNLNTLFSKSSTQNPYGMRDYRPTGNIQAESTDINLQSMIKESLLEIKEKKNKSALSEGKIVKGRLSIISENITLKTKKQQDKFFGNLLSEMVYLNSQGFDKQVINEGFFDVLTSLFGHAPEGIMEYFKEYIGKWLIEHLTPVDPEGWVANIIITSIGNLAIGDIPKLTDCNFLTKLISKSVGEGAVRKLTHEKGLDGAFYDVLRNSIVDMLDTTSLVTKIEEGLGNVICPLLGGVKNKMDAATDKLKEKALAK